MTEIRIKDYDLFHESIKAICKMVEGAKFTIGENGMEVYGRSANAARGEFTTNAVVADETITFCLGDVPMFLKVLATVKDIHSKPEDFDNLKFYYDAPSFIKIESPKFKTKICTKDEKTISNFISKKITTPMTPVLEFVTTSDQIKYINQHSFIFSNQAMARIYISSNPEMENNVMYATIGNNDTNLNNSITLKMGLITFGTDEGRKIILDFDRLNLFNIIQSDEIKIQLMDKNALIYKARLTGKDETYFDFLVCSSMLAA